MSTPEANAAYLAALKQSEELRDAHFKAADEVHSATLDAIHQRMMNSRRTLDDAHERNRAQAAAGDGRQLAYDVGAQLHFDRRAALARHFGQYWIGPGDANASHAGDFVKEIDPDGSLGWRKPAEPTPPSRPVAFAGVSYDRPAHHGDDGTVRIANSTVVDPPRGTFSGDMLSAKAAAVSKGIGKRQTVKLKDGRLILRLKKTTPLEVDQKSGIGSGRGLA
jgi:hypothetical protein